MKQKAATTATSINIITSIFLGANLSLVFATFFKNILLIPALVMSMIALLCYLYSPRYYELAENKLIILFRFGSKEYGPVKNCTLLREERQFGIRIWGNGGLFSATGIFWSRLNGVFRAYVTRSGVGNLVMIETETQKIVISPEKPVWFVKNWHDKKEF